MRFFKVVLLVSSTMATAGDLGFDPGMRTPLAASLFPDRPTTYRESCPGSPTGRCYGTYGSGGGFYTLPIEADNSDMRYFPDYFTWVPGENGEWVAQLGIDTRNYPSTSTPAFYAGLQTNIPVGIYAGLDFNNPNHAPSSIKINHASLEFRAVVCPQGNDPYFLTLHYYSDGWALDRNKGYSLAFNYGFSWNTAETPWIFSRPLISQGLVMRDLGMPESSAAIYDTTIWVDSHYYGMLPIPANNSAVTVSCTTSISDLPWRKVIFPVKAFLEALEARDIIYPLREYRYTGGIIAGVESWGRVKVVIQVKNHRMRSDVIKVKEAHYRLPDQTLWQALDGYACRYISLEHAEVNSAHDIPLVFGSYPKDWSWCLGYESHLIF